MDKDDLFSVEGHGIIVTGSASGIGRAVASGLAARGAQVTAFDLGAAGLDELRDAHPSIRTEVGDAADEARVAEVVAAHLASVGRLDAVCSIAGIAGPAVPTEELAFEDFNKVLQVNINSAFLLAKAAIPTFRAQGRGRIVLTSSIWGVQGTNAAPMTPYATSKGAVANLTKQLAVELAPAGITVNAILPGSVATRIADGFYDDPDAVAGLVARTPAGRVTGPESAVGPVTFLCSDASEWVTGHLLPVDGGYLAM